MPASPDSSFGAIVLSDPADFISVVPYLLGFHPTQSLVLVMFDGDVFKGVARFELPDHSADTPTLADSCARVSTQHANPRALLLGYGPGALVTPVMDGVFTALSTAGVEIMDALRCDEGRYWSYVCPYPECCPPDGVPYDVASNSAALGAILAGYTALPDRDTFRQRLDHDTGPGREAVRVATLAARKRADKADTDMDWFAEGLQRIRECFDHVQAGRAIPAEELAWLSVLLTGIFVRDIAMTFCREYGDDVSERFWTEVTRRVEPEFVPAPATNLAFLTLRSGNGTLARIAVERALAVNPSYSFANMIAFALNVGMDPGPLCDVDFAELAERITELARENPLGARPVLPPVSS
ncbi:DUF4192 domain-containing protein [Nonomuraea sp. NPDC059194]|uniref:DUF4192 domain-containing protein n=1 Tax=Nonomuraea sp. NPDC059194 TaxID=3346764 RepID=UPI00367CF7B9